MPGPTIKRWCGEIGRELEASEGWEWVAMAVVVVFRVRGAAKIDKEWW